VVSLRSFLCWSLADHANGTMRGIISLLVPHPLAKCQHLLVRPETTQGSTEASIKFEVSTHEVSTHVDRCFCFLPIPSPRAKAITAMKITANMALIGIVVVVVELEASSRRVAVVPSPVIEVTLAAPLS
jgi:hypothetical protein